MASPHPLALHAPPIAATVAIAPATTLVTPTDSTPALALDDYAGEGEGEGEHENHGGALSIASAAVHEYAALTSLADSHSEEEELVDQLGPAMDHPHALSAAFDPFEPIPTHQLPSMQLPLVPLSHIYNSGHMSSYDPSLEPPPFLEEAHLNLPDRTSFAPITSFFHSIAPERPTIPGLDLVQVPRSIARADLRGDRCDIQGIDWTVRYTTRSHVRAKRVDYESAKLPHSLHEVRSVCSELILRSRLTRL